MKYLILFKSGRLASAVKIQSNHPYENHKYSYMVDDTEYCYVDRTYICETADYYKQRISCTLPSFYSYRPENGCWFVDRDIKCIIAIDEMEADEMNKLQTTDFNAGMMYAQVERDTFKMVKNKDTKYFSSTYTFPRIQLFPKLGGAVFNDITTKNEMLLSVATQFDNVFGKHYKLVFKEDFPTGSGHYTFTYTIERKEEVKEMTIAEIEDKLGYKIKVVGEQ